MKILNDFPEINELKKICQKMGVPTYLVGGYLRDFYLKRDCYDLDFAVKKNALKIARRFAGRIKGAFVVLDEEHGCARVVKKRKGELIIFDFADFRDTTLSKDLSRRDFTINTLTADILKLKKDGCLEKVIKDHQKALMDISQKQIKQTSDKAFKEDPLRILRAFSLKANLGFKIEKETLEQIKNDREQLKDVSPERVREELFKILTAPKAVPVLKAMDRHGILAIVIPQIRIMADCKQGGYHHLDVWPHSLEVVNQLEKMFSKGQLVLKGLVNETQKDCCDYLKEETAGGRTRLSVIKLACLLHDIGKPDTRKKEKGRLSFHGHEHVGRNIVKHIARQLKLSTKERHMLEDMVLWHLRPGYLSNFKHPTKKSIYRYFRDTKDEAASILLLSLADQRSTRGPLTSEEDQQHHEKICLRLIEEYFLKKKEKPLVRLIDGNDIMRHLKMKPSPLIGELLKRVEEDQVLGKIKTKEEALGLARKVKELRN